MHGSAKESYRAERQEAMKYFPLILNSLQGSTGNQGSVLGTKANLVPDSLHDPTGMALEVLNQGKLAQKIKFRRQVEPPVSSCRGCVGLGRECYAAVL